MPTALEIRSLVQSGRSEEAVRLALQAVGEADLDPQTVKTAAHVILTANRHELLPSAVALLSRPLPGFSDDLGVQASLAHAAWSVNNVPVCIAAAKRAIGIDHTAPAGYRTLGMVLLTSGQHTDALLALAAGMHHCADKTSLAAWYTVALHLNRGVREVRFAVDGQEYAFRLACYNGMALETCAHHASGQLCELEELRHVRDTVGPRGVVVECGCLVGNHTVFFCNALKPRTVFVFDADQQSVAQTQENFEINRRINGWPTELRCRCSLVGRAEGTARWRDREMPVTSIDREISGPADFIKIDVDGAEMDVLEGARETIRRCRPAMMVEVAVKNRTAFLAFLSRTGYVVDRTFPRDADWNYVVLPGAG